MGFNYRLTDFQSALGYSQLTRYKFDLKKRRTIAKRYIKNLIKFDKISICPFNKNNSYFIFPVLVFRNNRDRILKKLKLLNIGCSIHYATPLFCYKFYKKKYYRDYKRKYSKYLKSISFANYNISLPVYSKLSLKEVDIICKKIINIVYEQ